MDRHNPQSENTSGRGADSQFPEELRGWNWGAFLLNWIWGIGNSVYIAFLMFVPVVNIFMLFKLGMKGNEWAWRKKRWNNIQHFRRVQKNWAIAGCVFWFFWFLVVIPLTLYLLGNSQAAQLAVTTLHSNSAIVERLGAPIKTGWIMGSINSGGNANCANLSFSVTGSSESGTVFFQAVSAGQQDWILVSEAVSIGNDFLTIAQHPDPASLSSLIAACHF